MILNEVYVGRTDEIQEFFEEFTRVRHVYINKMIKTPNYKDFESIENHIKKIWGFKEFEFGVDPDPSPNAYTFPVVNSCDVNVTEYLEITNKGYRFKKEAGLVAISKITAGLYCNKNFTDEETFAVFLHELGHSFVTRSRSIADSYSYLTREIVAIQIILLVLSGKIRLAGQALVAYTNEYRDIVVEINKALRKNPITRTIQFTVSTFKTFINTIVYNIWRDFKDVTGLRLLNILWYRLFANVIFNRDAYYNGNANGRSQERLADDFATMYGFGQYLSTALIKFESRETYDPDTLLEKFGKHVPGIKQWLIMQEKLAYEIRGVFDVHPTAADRCLKILENMKHDLKSEKNLSPKMKKELSDSVAVLEDEFKKIKKHQGLLAENPDEYRRLLIAMGFEDGSSETEYEKSFTNQDAINKDFNKKKVYVPRREQADYDEDNYVDETFDLYSYF